MKGIFNKNYEQLTEEELAHRWSKGDEYAGDLLIERLYDNSFYFLLKRLEDEALTAEVLQIALDRIFVKIKEGKIRNFLAYYWQTLDNISIEHFSKTNFEKKTQSLEETVLNQTSNHDNEEFLIKDELDTCLNLLPPHQKQAIQLKIAGYKQREIEKIMGKSPNQVRGLLHRARTTLRGAIDWE